ncbi:hypothetical protein JRO89_XS04G0136800 [Xanthoceras sorbifolium]|uniref:CCHC-type domain-containing protein n=1 Tax=Xanthoceras sorbifolium TaxID=99658 RepID=A0ABQ8I5R5_9ROSI|nr:hypothetical protein JRO89_XS04G0136800 [Xanthoceras sorbifolium]
MADYLATVQSLVDQLEMIGEPVPNRNLVLHTLNGLRSEFKELSVVVRTRDTVINFDELYDKLIECESYLNQGGRQESNQYSPSGGNNFGKNNPYANAICQFCDKNGHVARFCYTAKRMFQQQPTANLATTGGNSSFANWLLDSGTSHHVTVDLNNLSLR